MPLHRFVLHKFSTGRKINCFFPLTHHKISMLCKYLAGSPAIRWNISNPFNIFAYLLICNSIELNSAWSGWYVPVTNGLSDECGKHFAMWERQKWTILIDERNKAKLPHTAVVGNWVWGRHLINKEEWNKIEFSWRSHKDSRREICLPFLIAKVLIEKKYPFSSYAITVV